MKRIIDLFTEHPKSMNETYLQHLLCASTYGVRMVFVGVAAIIHAIFPFLFETTTSDLAKEIVSNVDERFDIASDQTTN